MEGESALLSQNSREMLLRNPRTIMELQHQGRLDKVTEGKVIRKPQMVWVTVADNQANLQSCNSQAT